MSSAYELIANAQNDAAPPRHRTSTLEQRQDDDFRAKGGTVAEQLRYLGYDPVQKLVEACEGEDLNVWQKTVLDRELLQYVAPKLRAIEHSGKGGGPIPLVISSYDDENI